MLRSSVAKAILKGFVGHHSVEKGFGAIKRVFTVYCKDLLQREGLVRFKLLLEQGFWLRSRMPENPDA